LRPASAAVASSAQPQTADSPFSLLAAAVQGVQEEQKHEGAAAERPAEGSAFCEAGDDEGEHTDVGAVAAGKKKKKKREKEEDEKPLSLNCVSAVDSDTAPPARFFFSFSLPSKSGEDPGADRHRRDGAEIQKRRHRPADRLRARDGRTGGTQSAPLQGVFFFAFSQPMHGLGVRLALLTNVILSSVFQAVTVLIKAASVLVADTGEAAHFNALVASLKSLAAAVKEHEEAGTLVLKAEEQETEMRRRALEEIVVTERDYVEGLFFLYSFPSDHLLTPLLPPPPFFFRIFFFLFVNAQIWRRWNSPSASR
jgi:hypothetical protein